MSAPSWVEFYEANGRPPHLGDEIPPWRYRGWLLFYVQEIQRVHPGVPDRWGYLHEVHETGRWPAEPIPRIEWATYAPSKDVIKQITAATDMIAATGQGWGSFSRFVEWLAFGLAQTYHRTDEPRYEPPTLADDLQEKLYRHVNLGPWLLEPYDYLGYVASDRFGGGPNAFFPTPHTVCEAMTQMMLADDRSDLRGRSVCDPCVGSGRMLLHASNSCMFLFGQDIDPMMVLITKINGALYAPWLVCPPPEHLMGKTRKTVPPPPTRRKVLPPPPGG